MQPLLYLHKIKETTSDIKEDDNKGEDGVTDFKADDDEDETKKEALKEAARKAKEVARKVREEKAKLAQLESELKR